TEDRLFVDLYASTEKTPTSAPSTIGRTSPPAKASRRIFLERRTAVAAMRRQASTSRVLEIPMNRIFGLAGISTVSRGFSGRSPLANKGFGTDANLRSNVATSSRPRETIAAPSTPAHGS